MKQLALIDETRTSAVLSACGTYRYALERRWADGDTVLFVMLNPSTADAEHDDPTIGRCIGFARAWGFGRLTVANLYARRSTDPDALRQYTYFERAGALNDFWLGKLADEAALVVAAWGAHAIVQGADVKARRLIGHLHVLRLTKDGHPHHPLYLPGELLPVRWAP